MYEYKVDFAVMDASKRKIFGIATSPTEDKEKEIILTKAIEEALPDYLRLPVLTYKHTERPVGMVEKASFNKRGGLEITAWIKDTPDADDVWSAIQKGDINAFSIYGARIQGNDQCRLHPTERTGTCVSSKIRLDAITLCSDNKVNPDAGFNIIKSIIEDSNIKDELLKGNVEMNTEINKSCPCEDKPDGEIMTEPIEEVIPEIEKAEVEPVTEVTEVTETIEKALGPDDVDLLVKAQFDTIQKATVVLIEEKAEEIRKAFEVELSSLKEELENVKNETILKGGAVVVIEEGKAEPKVASGNADAINKFLKMTR